MIKNVRKSLAVSDPIIFKKIQRTIKNIPHGESKARQIFVFLRGKIHSIITPPFSLSYHSGLKKQDDPIHFVGFVYNKRRVFGIYVKGQRLRKKSKYDILVSRKFMGE